MRSHAIIYAKPEPNNEKGTEIVAYNLTLIAYNVEPQKKDFCMRYIRVRVSRFRADPNSGVGKFKNNSDLDGGCKLPQK